MVKFIELNQVDSTNNYATALAHAGMAQHGTCVFAHHQTNGKGQRNKEWFAQQNQNITCSIILEPTYLNSSEMFWLSKAVALGGCKFLKKYINENVTIKWPNDLYWCDRKAGGILIENIIQGSQWKFAICGIGINVNQVVFDDLQTKAVSLKQITGIHYQPISLAQELATDVLNAFDALINNHLFTEMEYKKSLYKWKQKVRLKKANRVFEAIILDVTSAGQLVVKHAIQEQFNVGQIEWII